MNENFTKNILLSNTKYINQKNYWMNKLGVELERTKILPDFSKEKTEGFSGGKLSFSLPHDTAEKVIKLSKGSDLSTYIILLSAIKGLVNRYTDVPVSVVGSPVYMPNYKDDTLNSKVALLDFIKDEMTFKDIILSVRNTCIEAYENQDYPFEDIVSALNLEVEEGMPVFDMACMLENIHEYEHLKDFNGDMLFCFSRNDKEIRLKLEYNDSLFFEETMERFVQNYFSFLGQALLKLDDRIVDVEYTSYKEKETILNVFNNNSIQYEDDKMIHQLFEDIVLKRPSTNALVFKDEVLTYEELNQKANRLAHFLRKNGVDSECIVGVAIERSCNLIISLLAVLKAGGAYLPIDTEHPHQRVLDILEDADAKLMLAGESVKYIDEIKEQAGKKGIEIIFPSKIGEILHKEASHNITCNGRVDDLAYVIYTSGSTGKPKGVMIEHRTVVNLLKWFCKQYDLENNSRILQLTNVTFDVSVEEIFGSLVSGATLYMPSAEIILDRESFRSFIKENEISIAQFVPVTLREFLSEGEKIQCLRKVICGGDRLDTHLKDKITALGYELYNHYGPTESTVDAIVEKCKDGMVTLGKPIDNTKVYIVDKYNNLKPIGAEGEICISGKCLARGYVKNTTLTDEKFVDNPFIPGARMYKTGDAGRWLPDGRIEFLGRKDNQAKIRGFRIEIGEIEYWLNKYEAIKEAVVVVRDDDRGNKNLCAYVVAEEPLDFKEVKEFLMKALPNYMVPASFMQLDKFPCNANGKVDRKSLPEPVINKTELTAQDIPRNVIEEKMAEVWSEVLGVEKVGIKDNFFDLGGDSIKAIQIVSRLKKRQLIQDIKDIFKYPVLGEMSRYVKFSDNIKNEEFESGEVNLTPIQKWFFEQNFTEKNHWNQSVVLFTENRFNETYVEKAIDALVGNHDALRIIFKEQDSQIYQYNLEYNRDMFYFKVVDFMNEADYKHKLKYEAEKIQKEVDLSEGPLLVSALFKTLEGDYLMLAIHHLVVDGISWRILLEDFTQAYKQLLDGKEIKFQDKSMSFKAWSNEIYKYATSKKLLDEIPFWKSIEETEVLPLGKAVNNGANRLCDSNTLTVSFSKEYTEKFLKQANKTYNTEANDLLLAALGLALKKWTGMDKVSVNLEGHGREMIYEEIDISRTVGWFTTVFPVILEIKDSDLSYFIRYVKEGLRKIPCKGFGYGILKYITSRELRKDLDFKLKPEISFNYLGQFESEVKNEFYSITDIADDISVSKNSERVSSIDINGMVKENTLEFLFNYNINEFSETRIQQLIEYFQSGLMQIIDHCMENNDKKTTPTDLGYGKLSLEGLDKLKKMLNQKK